MDQLNDPSLVTQVGSEGTCTWCGRYGVNGTRVLGENTIVTAKNGTSIALNRPLYHTYGSAFSPELGRQVRNPIKWAGVEDLTIQPATVDIAAGDFIRFEGSVYCWARNVEAYNVTDRAIHFYWGNYGGEVRDCYVHDATIFDAGRGYGISSSAGAFDVLIENNICYHLHALITLDAGAAGCVVAYNYVDRSQLHPPGETWFVYHIGTHGAHCFMNLFEGNVCGKVQGDNIHGSASHNVFFRNRITRLNSGPELTQDLIAAIVDAHNYYFSFIGNIIGTPGCAGPTEQNPFLSEWKNPVLWKIGYNCCSRTGSPDDAKVAATLIRTGNWEGTTNAVQWDPNITDHTIPDSLYLTSKPAWFGALAWPPFTPERSGFNPANINKIPAQVRFENGPAVGFSYIPPRGY
jgi:hypothetical protein